MILYLIVTGGKVTGATDSLASASAFGESGQYAVYEVQANQLEFTPKVDEPPAQVEEPQTEVEIESGE